MNSKVDKDLIRKYLSGFCNEEELIQIKEYLKQPNAQQLFDEVWDERWADQIKADVNAAAPQQMERWKKIINQKINDTTPVEEETVIPFYKKRGFWQYAAMWTAIIVAVGLWTIDFKKTKAPEALAYIEKYNPNGRRTIITLPDSSQVFLGAGSKLRYAAKFTGNTRELSLEGEAFFDVKKNPKKPFIIHTGIITTQVLGTSFKVEAFLNKPLSVSVSTGKVRVDRHQDHKTESLAILTPGQTVTWNEKDHQKTLGTAVVEDISGWKDGRLIFDETRLSEITNILERWYDVKINFKHKKTANQLMKINLTANVPINKLMKILSISGQFKYHIEGKDITII